MAAEIIGRCTCPICASTKASLRLSTKQLGYVHCNACHFQGFARSDHSDTLLRKLLIHDAAPAPAAPAPAAPAPAAPAPAEAKPETTETKPAKRAAWGFGAGV